MKVKTIPSDWIRREGQRLDSGPFMSGAIEARMLLEDLSVPKERLDCLTSGFNGGIYNGPQFRRNYVDSPEHGVPFLTSGTILRADLSTLKLLRRKDAESPKLSYLELRKGMTLISCSGTIGRMTYARPDMDGLWSSQDVMKVVPDDTKIRSGYVYAFLASKYGVPLVIARTYGAIIRHLEPEHIADLPVPRLGDAVEQQAHQHVEEAARAQSNYQEAIAEATDRFFESVGLNDITTSSWHASGPDLGFSQMFPCKESLRALNFNPRFRELVERIKQGPWKTLADVCVPGTLRRGGRYKRIDAEPEFAYQLIGQKQLFALKPTGRWVAKFALGDDVLVKEGTILVAAQGTLGESELFCRAEMAWGPGVGNAYSEHILRVIADPQVMPYGCLYAYMRSETTFRILRSISTGTKLQDHHYIFRGEIPVPIPSTEAQNQIHKIVVDAYASRYRGIELEQRAVRLVEQAIKEAA